MRPSTDDIRAYYATPDGRRVARLLAATVVPTIRRRATDRLLAAGYPTPVLAGFDPRKVERIAVAMTGGPHRWPATLAGCAFVAEPEQLPFTEALFDQALLVHALEFAESPAKTLRELWRVLGPAGELVLVVPNRAGLWTHFEMTPFGQGRPWGRGELGRLLGDAMFEAVAWRTALVAPPVRGLRWLDRPLTAVARRFGGIHFVLARKVDGQAPALVGRVARGRVRVAATAPAAA